VLQFQLIGHTALLRELYTLAAAALLSFDPLAASLKGVFKKTSKRLLCSKEVYAYFIATHQSAVNYI